MGFGGDGKGGPEKAQCSLHGKMRTLDCMVDNGDGSYSCTEGFECKDGNKGVICRFFLEGRCTKGDACGFSHEEGQDPYAGGPPAFGAIRGKGGGKEFGPSKGWEKGGAKGWDSWLAAHDQKGCMKGWAPQLGPASKGAWAPQLGPALGKGYAPAWGKGDGKSWGKDMWAGAPYQPSPWEKGGCSACGKGFVKGGKAEEERAWCSVHSKMRTMFCLTPLPDGTFECRPDKECQNNEASGVKTAMCKFFLKGQCDRGEECVFAHSEDEIGTAAPEALNTDPKGKGKGKAVFEEKAMCAIHNKLRSVSCLQEAGGGVMVCTAGSGCRQVPQEYAQVEWGPPPAPAKGYAPIGGKGFKGGSKGSKSKEDDGKGWCVAHSKLRFLTHLQDVGDGLGSLVCIEGSECAGSADGGVKRAMCKFFLEGRCSRGDACVFAHAEEEIGEELVPTAGGEMDEPVKAKPKLVPIGSSRASPY